MFKYTAIRPAECKGLIQLRNRWPVLGPNEDVDGNVWDISAFGGSQGKGWCCAVPQGELHAYYTDTSGQCFSGGVISQTWDAYEWRHTGE